MDNLQWVNTWARYRATDASGEVWEFEDEPEPRDQHGEWMPNWEIPHTFWKCVHYGPTCSNWRETLEQRPAAESKS